MERERGSKVIAIVALCVGIVGLSLGFASFSSNLTIKSSASVTPEDNFSVYFDEDSIEATPVGGATAGNPTVSNVEKVQGTQVYQSSEIGDLSAAFTAPGQSVTYTFNAVNNGQYLAYLTDVTFATPEKTCTAGEGTTEANVNGATGACNGVSLKLEVGGVEITSATEAYTNTIAIGQTTEVKVTISYVGNAVEGQVLADGPFTVKFGDIGLVYESVR